MTCKLLPKVGGPVLSSNIALSKNVFTYDRNVIDGYKDEGSVSCSNSKGVERIRPFTIEQTTKCLSSFSKKPFLDQTYDYKDVLDYKDNGLKSIDDNGNCPITSCKLQHVVGPDW